jgi:hypothetical protein
MKNDRLPLRTLFGMIGGRTARGPPPKTWIEKVREDLLHLSELHGVFGTYINWWVRCKDRKAWTIDIHKLKQTNNTCTMESVQAAIYLSVGSQVSNH